MQRYAARLFRNTFLNFVSNFSLEGGNWVVCLLHQHFSKMGYFKCTILFNICTISFYLIMTLVVLCLDNIYIYGLLISELAKIDAMKPIFFYSGSPRGEGGFMRAWAWFVVIVQYIY